MCALLECTDELCERKRIRLYAGDDSPKKDSRHLTALNESSTRIRPLAAGSFSERADTVFTFSLAPPVA